MTPARRDSAATGARGSSAEALRFDPAHPEVAAAPWGIYARLREEAPVYALPGMGGSFAVSRYADVRAILSDAETFSSTLEPAADPMLMVFRDGASHEKLRGVMAAAFTPRAIEAVRSAVESTARSSLAALLARGRGDLVTAWCQPIPQSAIAEILGVPADLSGEFRGWARDLLAVQQEAPEPDAPQPVSDFELMMQGLALMTAGIDTTSMLLASGAHALCAQPDIFTELRAAVAQSAASPRLDGFVHEVLRLWSPVQWTHRRVTRDLELRGTRIPRNAIVLALIGSANRDPARFDDPDGPALVSREGGTHGFERLPVILER